MSLRPLTALEARVLAVLVEKQHTVPDSYPLSLNALTLGCNQKTARDPVMQASEADVLAAINGLKELSLVNEVSGSRVVRFDHNAARGLGVPGQSVALLTMLMLRGPQTTAELRLHTERLHRFADISSVEGFLEELAERAPRRVVRLPRAPGAREPRWAHLLCGELSPEAMAQAAAAGAPAGTGLGTGLGGGLGTGLGGGGRAAFDAGRAAALEQDVADLRAAQQHTAAELAALKALVSRMAQELSLDGPA